ncbi:MAG TPA: carboxypeptidase-like regulatory domain-containing protein, partial [Sediminibacterium sp.]
MRKHVFQRHAVVFGPQTTLQSYLRLVVTCLCALLLTPFAMQAQERSITGVVTSNDGPLPGVSVKVKGTNRGTQTGIDGKFTISASKGQTIQFSFIGYADQ